MLVPERDKVFPNLTVAENLLAPLARAASMPPSGAGARRSSISSFPQLAICAHRIGGLLSGGERQMLALGSALVCGPELLLVDELSLGLAPGRGARICCGCMAEIRRELGITILIVEQSATVALEIADYGYVHGEWTHRARRHGRARCAAHRDIQDSISAAERRAPKLSRGQAISPQPEMVWLSSRSIA